VSLVDESIGRQMSESLKSNIIRDILLVLASSFLAAFFSVFIFGERLEQKKTELAIEKKIIENQMQVIERVIEKASTLLQLSPLYRQYDLVTEFYPKAIVEMAKDNEAVAVSKAEIMKAQKDFQIALFSSKPFVSEEIFGKLAMFGMKINHFNFLPSDQQQELHRLFESAGNEYSEVLRLIRKMYITSEVSRDS
jgi:valyl-tRNA synthetase